MEISHFKIIIICVLSSITLSIITYSIDVIKLRLQSNIK